MSELLPHNATAAERALAEAMARISDVPIMAREVWNPDTIPSDLLPWLAWAFSVDEWDSNWSDEQRRATVKSAIAVQQVKGTVGAVREALAALGISIQVQEWFQQEPQAAPYTFALWMEADQTPVGQAGINAALAVVMNTKNLRSHLSGTRVNARSESRLRVGAVAGIGQQITVNNFRLPVLVINELAIVLEQ